MAGGQKKNYEQRCHRKKAKKKYRKRVMMVGEQKTEKKQPTRTEGQQRGKNNFGRKKP